jgi:hypothetical protein
MNLAAWLGSRHTMKQTMTPQANPEITPIQ